MDTNKDRFLTEEEFKKAQEAETKKMRAVIQAMQPAQPPAQPRPAPAQPRGGAAAAGARTAAPGPGAGPAAGHAVGDEAASLNAGSPPMKRLFGPSLLAAAIVTLPVAAQTSAPAPSAPPAQHATGTPVPLPQWFVEIDTGKKGEVTRAEFLKYRMKPFEELDINKDGKLTLEEFIKIAEPPFSQDVPNGPTLEERKNRARAEFQNLDTNRDGFVERAEAETRVPFRVQPVRHGPRQQGDRARGPPDRAALDGARGGRAPADRGAPPPGHAGDQRIHRHGAARGRQARQEQRQQD